MAQGICGEQNHVPNLDKGLSEVKRILTEDGEFYCATYGENGINGEEVNHCENTGKMYSLYCESGNQDR